MENMVLKEQVNSCIWARWVAVKSWIFLQVCIIQRSRTFVARHVLIALDLYLNRKSCWTIEKGDIEPFTFGKMLEDGWITGWRYVKKVPKQDFNSRLLSSSISRWYHQSTRTRYFLAYHRVWIKVQDGTWKRAPQESFEYCEVGRHQVNPFPVSRLHNQINSPQCKL